MSKLLRLLGLLLVVRLVELVQSFVGRDAAWSDLAAEAIGLLLAIAATGIFRMNPAATVSE